ncbi:hypothetical protein [Psychrobacter sp. ENNN9_III]|uniref:hypothetical protein n=1 Tax=Psychrobacter sp. ENNN9_III TaxID=1254334 RepID=UPI00071E8133|nr:hypothetical protein [Psychrobacter sp. ENNN9_III]
MAGDGYPLGAVVSIVAALFSAVCILPMKTDVGAVIAVSVYGAATGGINDTGTHQTCETGMRCAKLA